MNKNTYAKVSALLLMIGCGNQQVQDRQKLVERYGTSEVQALPGLVNHYIVRDTNASIWYVDFRGPAPQFTRMFDAPK